MVDALGDEGHERMEQAQGRVENEGQDALSGRAGRVVAHARLDEFEVPVAQFVPEKAVEQVIDKFSHIDILINNAGITRDKLILRMKEEDWDKVIQINLKSAFNCIKAVSSFMLRERKGRIINISSIIALRGNRGQANYAASKAGLIGLTKSIAREFATRAITVNAVAPGFIQTKMTEKLMEREEALTLISQIPLGRVGLPEEVASLVAYLASDEACYITGEVIKIDGGLSM